MIRPRALWSLVLLTAVLIGATGCSQSSPEVAICESLKSWASKFQDAENASPEEAMELREAERSSYGDALFLIASYSDLETYDPDFERYLTQWVRAGFYDDAIAKDAYGPLVAVSCEENYGVNIVAD